MCLCSLGDKNGIWPTKNGSMAAEWICRTEHKSMTNKADMLTRNGVGTSQWSKLENQDQCYGWDAVSMDAAGTAGVYCRTYS